MDKKEQMLKLREEGLSYQDIGRVFGVSRQRVHQIISGYNVIRRRGWYKEVYLLVLERDKHKCQSCNKDNNLIVHHQDRDNMNNNISNLVTLCRSCHSSIHGGNNHLGKFWTEEGKLNERFYQTYFPNRQL